MTILVPNIEESRVFFASAQLKPLEAKPKVVRSFAGLNDPTVAKSDFLLVKTLLPLSGLPIISMKTRNKQPRIASISLSVMQIHIRIKKRNPLIGMGNTPKH